MTKNDYCHLWLTCADKAEANRISKSLLKKRLIACAKQIPVSSDFHWQNKIDHAAEILLIMDSRADLFGQVEAEVSKLHTYETFVLEATVITNVSKKATDWLKKELKNAEA